jgi:hypothetical protein
MSRGAMSASLMQASGLSVSASSPVNTNWKPLTCAVLFNSSRLAQCLLVPGATQNAPSDDDGNNEVADDKGGALRAQGGMFLSLMKARGLDSSGMEVGLCCWKHAQQSGTQDRTHWTSPRLEWTAEALVLWPGSLISE